MESKQLDHGIIAGILKTVFLFLEGQNLPKTCETFLLETESLGYPPIRSAIAQILILKPAVTETVTVSRASPDTDFVCHCDEKSKNHQEIENQDKYQNKLNDQNNSGEIEQDDGQNDNQNGEETDDQNDGQDDYEYEQKGNDNDETEDEYKYSTKFSVVSIDDPYLPSIIFDMIAIRCSHSEFDTISNMARNSSEDIDDADVNAVNDDKVTSGESTVNYALEVEESCFPCEDCNKITPVSSNSIPVSPEAISERKSSKPSVSFSSKTDPYEYPKEKDERDQQENHQKQIEEQEDPKENFSLNDEIIVTSHETTVTEFKSISDIIENTILDNDIHDEEEVHENDFNKKSPTPKSESVDPETFNIKKREREGSKSNRRESYPFHRIGGMANTVNLEQKDDSTQVDTIDITEIIEAYNIGETKYIQLDYNRIKHDLNTQDEEFKLLLLQAIRWQITRTSPEDRNKAIVDLAKFDLLCLHGNIYINESKNNECSLIKIALLSEHSPNPLQEGISRLLNAIASCTLGRDYLCQDDRTLRFTIIPLVCGRFSQTNSIGISEMTKEHLLVILQKLSLRSKMRLVMIESGLPEYLVEFLTNKHELISDYCLEYSCALFMNLCLHKETKLGMRNISNYLLEMLKKLLTSNHQHCLPYLNGAMYSLFHDQVLREQAKRYQLHQIIMNEMETFEDGSDIKLQLGLIIQELTDKLVSMTCTIDCQFNEDVEIDHIEPEIDAEDPIYGIPNGIEVLINYKKKGEPSASRPGACLCHPVMPFKKITIKSFCIASEDDHEEHKHIVQDGLDAILTTVSEIDREIATNSIINKDDSSDQTDQIHLKDQYVSAQVALKNTSTQNKNHNNNKEKINYKTEYKEKYYRDRYDPSAPIIYNPILRCACVNKRNCQRGRQRIENCEKNVVCDKKYDCNCFIRMQKFVENNCGNCACPVTTTITQNANQNRNLESLRKHRDEDLFRSAVELIAMNCCKSDKLTFPDHIDCECYTTVFRSRPRIHRTP